VTEQEIDSRAIGWTWFAAVMMWLTGAFQAIAGMVGIFTDDFYPDVPEYLFRFNSGVWGWTHLVTGLVIFFAGAAILSGRLWARILAVIMVSLSILEAFAWLPVYPIWSVIIIAVGASVVWALTIHGHDIESLSTD
jgi:hypothetical protein